MACTDCNKASNVGVTQLLAGEPATLSYRAAGTHVTGRNGVKYRIDGPLVELRNRGQGGWKVQVSVKGHTHQVDGDTPQQVFGKVSTLLKDNNVSAKPIDIWFNLNLQWIKRAVVKRQPVTEANLMEMAVGNAAPVLEAKAARQNVPPAVWGSKGWGMLQQYLAIDEYTYDTFLRLATLLGTWVDPDRNPTTGCSDCYKHFTIALADLQKKPRYAQQEAREWLVAAMNRVNRYRLERGEANVRILTLEQASKANFWQ